MGQIPRKKGKISPKTQFLHSGSDRGGEFCNFPPFLGDLHPGGFPVPVRGKTTRNLTWQIRDIIKPALSGIFLNLLFDKPVVCNWVAFTKMTGITTTTKTTQTNTNKRAECWINGNREEHSMDQCRSRLKLSENFERHWSMVHTFSWGIRMDQWS